MVKTSLTFLIALMMATQAFSQQEGGGLVNWLTFKEAQEKNKLVPRPFLIDLYTDWCGWCKHMMKTTYSNPGIASYINTNFYPVKFDAETKDTVEYNGKIYKPISPAPKTAHELTIKFLGNNLSYPSTIFTTNKYEYNLLVPGFIEDKKIEPLLIFMVENAWQTAVYDEFNKHFLNTFYDTGFAKTPVKVHTFKELEQLQKKAPKKVLISIGTEFCNSCKVMNQTTFVDTSIGKYLNKNFYLVKFDATTTDTILFKNEKYYNAIVNNFPMHTLCLKLSNNRFALPTLCVLDEQLNTIDALNFYQSPERLKPILAYIAGNSYKTKTFNDFMQEYMNPPAPAKKKK